MPKQLSRPESTIIISDIHAGSTQGLYPEDGVTLDDGQRVMPSPEQRLLHGHFKTLTEQVQHHTQGRQVNLVLLGDLLDGTPHDTHQVISRNMATQREIATTVLMPLLQLASNVWSLKGTSAHEGKQAQEQEALLKEWKAQGIPVNAPGPGRLGWYELWLEAAGVLMWFRHHGRGRASIARSRLGPAVRLASDTIDLCVDHGWPIPRLVFVGHAHQYDDSHSARPRCRAIFVPSFQLPTEYAYRIGAMPTSVGGVVVNTLEGEVEGVYVYEFPVTRPKAQRARSPRD